MRDHPCQPLTFLADICGRPASEKPFLLLVAGHPAEDATVPTAALNKKPLGGIAAWIQGREGYETGWPGATTCRVESAFGPAFRDRFRP